MTDLERLKELEDSALDVVQHYRNGTAASLEKCIQHLKALLPDEDPTPWCHACGAITQERCHCGAIADND